VTTCVYCNVEPSTGDTPIEQYIDALHSKVSTRTYEEHFAPSWYYR